MRCPKTFTAIQSALDREATLADEGTTISDELFTAIGTLSASPLKPRLVGLRRAVYQSRHPEPGEWNNETAECLPGSLRDRITAWCAGIKDHQATLDELAGVLSTELDGARGELRDICGDPYFQHALSHASPALYDVLRRWLTDPEYRPRRSSLARLAKYVARAATKTSPFSTFTISGRADWTTEAVTDSRLLAPGRARNVVEMTGPVVDRLRRAMATAPELRPLLPVRTNPSLTRQDGVLSFLRPGAEEPIVSVPETGATRAVLDTLQRAGERCTVAELVSLVAHEHGKPTGEISRFLDRILATGLLEAHVPVTDQATSPFASLGSQIAESALDRAAIRDHVTAIESELTRQIAVTELHEHRERRRALADATRALADELTEPDAAEPVVAEEALASKMFAHDNAVFVHPVAECSLPLWRPALADLDLVRRWQAINDPALPLRLVLSDFVVERFGAGARIPFLELHRAVQQELDNPEGYGAELRASMDLAYFARPATHDSTTVPRLRELNELRVAATETLRAASRRGPNAEVPRSLVREMVSEWPAWVSAPDSVACYVHQVATPTGPILACDAIMSGHGQGRARVHRLVHMAGGPDTAPDVAAGYDPVSLADLSGAFGTALNRRTPTVAFELDYPGCVPERSPEQRVAMGDLVVEHDPGSDLLHARSTALDRRVRPVHVGGMAGALLPPAARLLNHAFEGNFLMVPPVPALPHLDAPFPPRDVSHQPRIQLGHVVLERACWFVPRNLVPAREPAESQVMFLYRLVRWLREHGIPDTCFVRAMGTPPAVGTVDVTENWNYRKSQKPVFIDYANPFAVEIFERLASAPDTAAVKFEEALPHPEDAHENDNGERRVTQFVVELAGPTRDA